MIYVHQGYWHIIFFSDVCFFLHSNIELIKISRNNSYLTIWKVLKWQEEYLISRFQQLSSEHNWNWAFVFREIFGIWFAWFYFFTWKATPSDAQEFNPRSVLRDNTWQCLGETNAVPRIKLWLGASKTNSLTLYLYPWHGEVFCCCCCIFFHTSNLLFMFFASFSILGGYRILKIALFLLSSSNLIAWSYS